MNEERMKILELLSAGKINAEEADKLLEKISAVHHPQVEVASAKPNAKKFLKIAIQDGKDTKVNINFPIALAKVGLNLAASKNENIFSKQHIDIDSIIRIIEEGAEGEIVNIQDEDTTVKIYID